MTSWVIIALAGIAVPIIAIAVPIGYAMYKAYLQRQSTREALEAEERRRQEEREDALLGLSDNQEVSAHLEVFEARLKAVEERLAHLDGQPVSDSGIITTSGAVGDDSG